MNKIKDFIIRHKMTLVVLFGLALGIGIGYVAFHKGGSGATASSENKKTIWTIITPIFCFFFYWSVYLCI